MARRIPASYTRFLWFMSTIGLALVALLAGQGYASIYLSSLPHTGFEGTAYVMFWTVNVNVLMLISIWILEEKVRSRALLFCFKYYYFLVSLPRTLMMVPAAHSTALLCSSLARRSTSCELIATMSLLYPLKLIVPVRLDLQLLPQFICPFAIFRSVRVDPAAQLILGLHLVPIQVRPN